MPLNILRNKFGFNLVEMMVGVAILAVVALAGATLAQVADQSTQYPDRKLEVSSFGSFIMGNLKNAPTCELALGGNNLLAPNANGKAQGNAKGVANGQHKLTNGPIQIFINNMANLDAGPSMGTAPESKTLDPSGPAPQRQVLSRRLQVNDLYLDDAVDLGGNTYLASVYLNVEEIGTGRGFKTQMIGSLTITTDGSANGAVANCQAVPSEALARTCGEVTGMNCDWDQNALPKCRCKRSVSLCPWPGYYPVKFTQKADDPNHGIADCRPLGGKDRQCPAGEFLTGIGLDEIRCAPAPNACPSGTSTTGAGNVVTGLIGCRCNNAGETYVTGVGCQGAPPPVPPSGCVLVAGTLTTENVMQDCQTFADATGWCPASATEGSIGNKCAKTIRPSGAAMCAVDGFACSTAPTRKCGPAHGRVFANAAEANAAGVLCYSGGATPSSLSGNGPWNWECGSSGSGGAENCTATQSSSTPTPTPGPCGPASPTYLGSSQHIQSTYGADGAYICQNRALPPDQCQQFNYGMITDDSLVEAYRCGPASATSCPWTQTLRNQAHHTAPDVGSGDPFMEASWDTWRATVASGSTTDTRSAWYLSSGQSDLKNSLGTPTPYMDYPACDSSRNGVKAFSAWAYGNSSANSKDQWGHVCNCP